MIWRFLKNLGIKPPYDPAIPLLGIYPEETILKIDTGTPVLTGALSTAARTRRRSRRPLLHEWAQELWPYAHEYYTWHFCVVLILSGSQPVASQFL